MTPARGLVTFLKAPAARKWLALESLFELLRARAITLGPAKSYTPALGILGGDVAQTVPEAQEKAADEIGRMVAAVARGLPIRAQCLQRAIAARRMLARRGIPATVCLGVARDRADRAPAAADRAAHAWVTVGSRVVSGREGLENYAVVARFA